MKEGTIASVDGRTIGFVDYGTPDSTAVLWCHGGPGSRLEAAFGAAAAARAGLRLVGIDRPGYGRSTEQPGRTIGGWVPDALAVLDHLGIDRFVTVGCSTGAAYALAVASKSKRVIGTVACCGLTDMRWLEGRAMVPKARMVWEAPDRQAAHAVVAQQFGADASRLDEEAGTATMPAADAAFLNTPEVAANWAVNVREMFLRGFWGYTDDRLADGRGWDSFYVNTITCPVSVVHGGSDPIVPVAHGYYTAGIVPGATMRVVERFGHLGIISQVVDAVSDLLVAVETRSAVAAAL